MRKYPCRHCEQSFNSATSLRRHIRSEHDGKRKNYSCWYCMDPKTTFTTSVMLKNHISLMHGIKNPDLSQMPKTSIKEFKNPLGKGIISASPVGDTRADSPDRIDFDAHSAKRLKTQLRCSKCGFITDDSTEFQQHIPQHKTDDNTPQCLCCGLCFTSVFSLNRHLFIVHKVKDPKEDDYEEEEKRHVGHFMGKKSVDGSLLETVFENINAPSEGRDVSPVARPEDVQALITKMWRGAQQTRKHTLDIEGGDPA
ncbi:hypothetical protein CHARACLAT_004976 [Characodon lateralis]|uniref:C2H2-type domain-containing protein n=1 Tax=Characodon lateralis TaxID=208331 RepID=A0ABU7F2N3_9TELE|nr:hypothetical protein [Characodon lateralis]